MKVAKKSPDKAKDSDVVSGDAEAAAGAATAADTAKAQPDTQPDEAPESQPEIRPETFAMDPAPVAVPAAPPPRRGMSVAVGLLLGGALTVALGYGAARYVVPEGWPFPGVTPEPDPLALAQAEQAARIEALQAQLGDMGERLEILEGDTRLVDLAAELDATRARVERLNDALNALDARLLEVEKIPRGSGTAAAEAAAAAYERELSAMREMLADELETIRGAQAAANATGQSAEQAARAAAIKSGLAELQSALDSGQPYGDALEALKAVGAEIPAGLADGAADGVASLPDLQAAYPEAARAALAASIAALVQSGAISRVEGFLRSQLGTRSLEPKEGDDPDAVLSRAEAAVKAGNLGTALAEIATLPEAGRAKMAAWVEMAAGRLAAEQGAASLERALNQEQGQ